MEYEHILHIYIYIYIYVYRDVGMYISKYHYIHSYIYIYEYRDVYISLYPYIKICRYVKISLSPGLYSVHSPYRDRDKDTCKYLWISDVYLRINRGMDTM